MGPERGMTVAELIEELRGMPPSRQVCLKSPSGERELLTKENLRLGGDGLSVREPMGPLFIIMSPEAAQFEKEEC